MICRDSACTWPIRHYHTDCRDERCPGDFVRGHRCVSAPACVDPRPGYALVVSDAAPRTLRIEVTDDDVAAGLATWAAKKDAFQRPLRLRAVLDVFACRLADRQWIEAPEGATIPAGFPTRTEGRGATWAHEGITNYAIPPDARFNERGYYVPADRVGELIMPEPPDLATRVHDRMRASFEADGLTIEGVRAALAAEGVE